MKFPNLSINRFWRWCWLLKFETRKRWTKGNYQYSWPPCSSMLLCLPKYFKFFTKTSYLNEEVNCTEPSLSGQYSLLKSLKNGWLRSREWHLEIITTFLLSHFTDCQSHKTCFLILWLSSMIGLTVCSRTNKFFTLV